VTNVTFGFISNSKILKRRFLPALLSVPEVEPMFLGIRANNKPSIRDFDFPIEIQTGTYEETFQSTSINSLYISSPPNLHFEHILEGIKHQKNIICEKPACLNQEQADIVLKEVKKSNLVFLEAFAYRFHPQHKKAINLALNSGYINHVEATFFVPMPEHSDIRLNKDLKGGVNYDSLGYLVNLANMIFKEQPSKVIAYSTIDKKNSVENKTIINFFYQNGASFTGKVGYGLQYESSYKIFTNNSSVYVERAFSVNPDHRASIIVNSGFNQDRITCDPVDQFELMINIFREAINQCNPNEFLQNFHFQYQTMQLVLNALKLN